MAKTPSLNATNRTVSRRTVGTAVARIALWSQIEHDVVAWL